MHQDDTPENQPEIERRNGLIEVQGTVDKLCGHIDRYITEDRGFHTRIEQLFKDHFGDFNPVEHKEHHSWTRMKIVEENARTEFLKKMKFEVVKNAVLIISGAIAMYIAVATWNNVAHDVVQQGSAPMYQTQPAQQKHD